MLFRLLQTPVSLLKTKFNSDPLCESLVRFIDDDDDDDVDVDDSFFGHIGSLLFINDDCVWLSKRDRTRTSLEIGPTLADNSLFLGKSVDLSLWGLSASFVVSLLDILLYLFVIRRRPLRRIVKISDTPLGPFFFVLFFFTFLPFFIYNRDMPPCCNFYCLFFQICV